MATPLVESARESRNRSSLKIDPPDGVPLKVAHHECPDAAPRVSKKSRHASFHAIAGAHETDLAPPLFAKPMLLSMQMP